MRNIEERAPRKCPLYPQERTFSEAALMSAKCHKRTLAAGASQTVAMISPLRLSSRRRDLLLVNHAMRQGCNKAA